jgi:hypothetical protein
LSIFRSRTKHLLEGRRSGLELAAPQQGESQPSPEAALLLFGTAAVPLGLAIERHGLVRLTGISRLIGKFRQQFLAALRRRLDGSPEKRPGRRIVGAFPCLSSRSN